MRHVRDFRCLHQHIDWMDEKELSQYISVVFMRQVRDFKSPTNSF